MKCLAILFVCAAIALSVTAKPPGKVELGGECWNHGQCSVTKKAKCIDGYCTCKAKYIAVSGECVEVCGSDIAFVVDRSGSIGSANYAKIKNFIIDLINRLPIGTDSDQVQVGLVTFNSNVDNEFFLNAYDNKTDVVSHVTTLPYYGGSTNTAGALQFVRENTFQETNGDRVDKANVVVVITDGYSNNGAHTLQEATLLKDAGVKIIAVGIGSAFTAELQAMASTPEDIFVVDDFDALDGIKDSINISSCQE